MSLPRFADWESRWQNTAELEAIVVIDSLQEDTCPGSMAEVDKRVEIAEMYCMDKDRTTVPSCTMSLACR